MRILISFMFGLFAFAGLGQDRDQSIQTKRSISLGIFGGDYGYDAVLGMELTSPEFIKNHISVRLKVNYTWLEHYKANFDQWATFNTYWCGLNYNTRTIDRGRVFVEGGSYLIAPDKKFSSTKYHFGYFASIGVELFVAPHNQNLTYFISGGFANTHAHADKIEGSPRYGSGLIFSNGFRCYLYRH